MEPIYIYHNNKRLRCGHTTGTCAAAATKAAMEMLLSGSVVENVSITVPKGIVLDLPIEDITIGNAMVWENIKKGKNIAVHIIAVIILVFIFFNKFSVKKIKLPHRSGESSYKTPPQPCLRLPRNNRAKARR